MGRISTDDTADGDDGIHRRILEQACRSIHQLEGTWHTEDRHLLRLLTAEHFERSLQQRLGDIIVPLRHSDAYVQAFT